MKPSNPSAVVLDFNGVLGVQPTAAMWENLTATAGWPADQSDYFKAAFWNARDAYDAGTITDAEFWTTVLGTEPTPRHLDELRAADTAMWTRTDDRVLAVLRRIREAGLPLVLLSNAPSMLADALDDSSWRRELFTEAVYSARLGLCKPDPAAYQQALAATRTAPEHVLFVDDRLDNCATARELGMHALHFTGDATELAAALAL
ncbi:HAD family phosphatase [Streptomyces sp. UH6]|uniref:HAD family hydrolase n=1 Tax=Streptomyces sp. UH6 TaxID=2748379 RepID=UPI0015D50C7A|nr:HAD family phosphatase [Streptomyces sp. UH6]NYV73313.1 HAD family phosphatase [Streptomyces sp. UH6]